MADEWQVGDWAFAYSSEDEYWYPAEIISINGGDIKIRYDCDESEEVLDEDSLDDYETYAGEQGAECWSEDDQEYCPVSILEVNGEQVKVKYTADGVVEWTDLSNLRFEDLE